MTEHALFERYAAAARGAFAASADGGGAGGITILVSHRFSTVRMADLIVVLDGARVAQAGRHDELIAKGGPYAELYGIQAAASGKRSSSVPPMARGKPAAIPAKMMSEMPLPMPRSVICSPSHMMKAVPAASEIIVMSRNDQPGSATTDTPRLVWSDSRNVAMP